VFTTAVPGTTIAMVVLLALLFPAVLLLLALAMERVEAPLRDQAMGDQVEHFLETARPEEVETFVRDGLARSLDRYWRRTRRVIAGNRSLTSRS
jgi:hypothetical protein